MPLAMEGGKPVRSEPLPGWPHFDERAVDRVAEVLRSGRVNYWTGGEGRSLEEEFAAFCGCRYGVAVANGTVALEGALRAAGVKPGDDVLVTSRTFIASASSIVMCGARPVFADVDPVSQNVTAETLEAVCTPRTTAVVAVHLAGWPCPMDPIMDLAERREWKVVEDGAQAHGARYKGRRVGSLGHVAAFSFCQDKILTTGGEGGMIVTDDASIRQRAWSFKDHGKDWDQVYRRRHPPGFRWLHTGFGTNGRMTEMQAAVGRVGLSRLPDWLDRRRAAAQLFNERFRQFPALRTTEPHAAVEHAYYKYYVFVRPDMLAPGWDRDRVMRAISAEGIPCFSGSCSEVYREQAFDASMRPPQRLAVARELGETSLMFLVHPTLRDRDLLDTCAAVQKVMDAATRRRTRRAAA